MNHPFQFRVGQPPLLLQEGPDAGDSNTRCPFGEVHGATLLQKTMAASRELNFTTMDV
jgi:hypothetical protein